MTITKELKDIELFSSLSDEDLTCQIIGDIAEYKQGEILFREGDKAEFFVVFLEGTVEIFRIIKGEKLVINHFTKGMTGGEMPLLAGSPHLGNAIALDNVKVLLISEDNFWRIMGNCKSVRTKILSDMSGRLNEIQTLSNQREKLISLGTMSAGLAHELNNPASAAKRDAQTLTKTLKEFDIHSTSMLREVMFKDSKSGSINFKPIYDVMKPEGIKLSPLQKSGLEEELIEWLEERGIEESWNIAPTLVSVGYTKENLEEFIQVLVPDHINNFLNWLHKDIEMRLLANNLSRSTERISELITAIKSYTYMDKVNEKSLINIHNGIDNTLIMLNFKLKQKNITVKKEYSDNLPKIMAYGGELNQVWTNLLDNAIDAIPDKNGVITIKTNLEPDNMISIDFHDNGTGIKKEIQKKLFEPFFTTKEIGKGTGMGLDISQRIVVNQHKGSIRVISEPGNTCFRVCLPL